MLPLVSTQPETTRTVSTAGTAGANDDGGGAGSGWVVDESEDEEEDRRDTTISEAGHRGGRRMEGKEVDSEEGGTAGTGSRHGAHCVSVSFHRSIHLLISRDYGTPKPWEFSHLACFGFGVLSAFLPSETGSIKGL